MKQHSKDGRAGIVVDTGTMRRIPFVIWYDDETGEYEAHAPAANGVDVLGDDRTGKPRVVRGRAEGKLVLLPLQGAERFGWRNPQLVKRFVEPTEDMKRSGLEQYLEVYVKVWQRREAGKHAYQRAQEYLKRTPFHDKMVVRRPVPVGSPGDTLLDRFKLLKRRGSVG